MVLTDAVQAVAGDWSVGGSSLAAGATTANECDHSPTLAPANQRPSCLWWLVWQLA
eukprot:COSAG01_NODE_69920_length_260_cov_0.621118_1_plen_55_part_10